MRPQSLSGISDRAHSPRFLGGLLTALILFFFNTGLMRGQASFPFRILVSTPTQSSIVQQGSTVAFLAEVGKTQTAHVMATYQGIGTVVISQPPQLFGSPSFPPPTLTGPHNEQTLPFTLNPGDSISLDLVYAPTSTLQVSAQLIQPFSETAPASTGTGLVTTQNSINLNLVGTAPSFALSYVLQTNLNVVHVNPGETIQFDPTLINTTAQATLNITNVGSGAGTVSAIAISGSAFKLQGLPLFPFPLNAGQNLQVLILYTPSGVATDTGQIQVTFGSGAIVTVNLSGSGSSSTFSYQVIESSAPPKPIQPGQTITLPDTNVGATGSLIVKVQNTGNAIGTVNSVNLTGQGFQLSGLPLTLPSLKPNDSFTFSITFTPTQPGPSKGQLAIGADLFSVQGRGLGPQFGFSYTSAAGTITLGANGAVVFTPITVSQSENVTFVVTNTGTSQATLSNIGIGESPSPYSVSGLPALPVSVDPGASFQFTITFAPITVGFANGTLRLDTTAVPLTGSGSTPPPLPAYSFVGAGGTVAPQSQIQIGLQLSTPYPNALSGTLTLSTSGNLPNDPAVQFATGGRTIPFLIPANSTNATFTGEGPQAFLQSGTVAETITLTPAFLTQPGGVNVTPDPPVTLQLTVPPAAPTLVSAQVVNTTNNGFTLSLVGYSSTRTLTSLNVTFTGASGYNVSSAPVTMDLTQTTPLWFQTLASDSFGGQFGISIPFTLQGSAHSGQTLLQAIASVSATVSNAVGASNSLQAVVP